MSKTKHWAEDTYWTDALDQLQQLRESGKTQITLDLKAIEEVAYNGDGPAYKLMDAMLSVHELETWDGYRGAPRVMLALLVRLQELSRRRRNPEQQKLSATNHLKKGGSKRNAL